MSDTVMIEVPTTARMLECCAGIAADGHEPKPAKPGSLAAEYLGMDSAETSIPLPAIRHLADLARRAADDPSELLRTGYLCRGGGLLLAGPTGVGKSSFVMQAQILFALGRTCFGIQPTRQLTSLYVQAENDEGDLAEMRDGVFAGLHLSAEEQAAASEFVITVHVNSCAGPTFVEQILKPLLKLHHPDLLWIDPAFAYVGAGVSDQKEISLFLRTLLNPLLTEFKCGCIIVHHTNKPATGSEKSAWQAGDFAYLGSGSIEWANWARAVLAIRSIGSHTIFELRAGKRGGRIGWRTPDGQTEYAKLIGHATEPGVICWRDVDPAELPATSVKRAGNREDLLALVPMDKPVNKALLIDQWKDRHGNKDKGRAFLESLVSDERLYEWRIKRVGTNAAKLISRHPQPEPTL